MPGIVAYGAHIPKLRLRRESIASQSSWLVPGDTGLADGEKAVSNWDEDSVTMAVAAAHDCLAGVDRRRVEALYLASTTLPFADRLNSGIVAAALGLGEELLAADFTSSQKAATTALATALEAVDGGPRSNVLVAAADQREARAGSVYELLLGDGAAALLVGREDVIAEFEGSHSVSHDFVAHYRGAERRFDYTWEERWVREEGYAKIIPQAVNGLFSKLGIEMDEVDHLVFPCLNRRDHALVARVLGATPEQVCDNLQLVCGETGAAHPLVMLVAALEDAEPGARIVVASFGQGSDALSFRVTERIHDLVPRTGVKGSLANRVVTDNYVKYLRFRELVATAGAARAEAPTQTTPSQDGYRFAEVAGSVKSVAGDALAVSPDPPVISGVIEFAGGGFTADFTDCTLEEIEIGAAVRMAFRKHAAGEERGFGRYVWKAVPSA